MTDTSLEAGAPDAAEPDESSQPTVETPLPTFADFDVHPDIVAALTAIDIVTPFPIQAMTLPVALGGHDIIGQAKTGTGKTLGFGVPILQRIVTPTDERVRVLAKPGKPQALVVCPTRELAVQVAGDLERAGTRRGARVITVYGGRAYEPQIDTLRKGVEIVVGTPGRLIDLLKQGHLDLSQARTVVLDEADEMLDLGLPPRRRDADGADLPDPPDHALLRDDAGRDRRVGPPLHAAADPHPRHGRPRRDAHTVKAIEQFVYRAHALDKVEMLARILQARGRGLTLVFSRTKRTAAKVADDLSERGFAAAAIHGDLGQGAREQALRAFRHGNVDVLVATDVAARGIDVENVTHVVNFQCPEDEKTYVHRIGRTARAGNTGIAVTFVDWDDIPRWGLINRQLDLGIPDPEETYSSSDHLYTELDIPTDVTGRLRKSQQTRAGLDAEELEDLGETGKASGRRNGKPADGGRDAGRRDQGRGEARAEKRVESGTEERPRRNRNRRRTVKSHDGEVAGAPAVVESPASNGSDPTSAPTEGATRRPRRRRRGGGGGGDSAGADKAAASTEG